MDPPPPAPAAAEEARPIRVVLCGNNAVGKTTMCEQASQLAAEKNTLFAVYEKQLALEGSGNYLVLLKDTQSGPELLDARKRAYESVDVVFLVYSVIQPDSLQAAKATWRAELAELAPGRPIILIGNKTDMRADEEVKERLQRRNMAPLSTVDGERAAQELGALGFFEISCRADRDPLERVFREGLLLVFGPPKQKKSRSRLAAPQSGNSNHAGGSGSGSMRGKNCTLQ